MAVATADLAFAHRGFPYLGPAKRCCFISPRGYQYFSIKPSHHVHGNDLNYLVIISHMIQKYGKELVHK